MFEDKHIPKFHRFPPMQRGTSFKIPIQLKKQDGSFFDLSKDTYNFYLTLKAHPYDYDYDDNRAYVRITGKIVNAAEGRVDFVLNSADTWFPPKTYYFDIEMINKVGAVTRLASFETEIIGGPTNRTIRKDTGYDPEFYSDGITFTFTDSVPLIFVTPLLAQIPSHLVENISVVPSYVWNEDDINPSFEIYGPRLSYTDSFTVDYYIEAGVPHNHTFQCSFLKPAMDIYDLGLLQENEKVTILKGQLANYEFDIFNEAGQQYKHGRTNTDDIIFSIPDTTTAGMGTIKIICTDKAQTPSSNVYIELTYYLEPHDALKTRRVRWNVKLDWMCC